MIFFHLAILRASFKTFQTCRRLIQRHTVICELFIATVFSMVPLHLPVSGTISETLLKLLSMTLISVRSRMNRMRVLATELLDLPALFKDLHVPEAEEGWLITVQG